MVNGNDLIEYEENNLDYLQEQFLEDNKKLFEYWLDLEGYDLFLKSEKERWNEYVLDEFNSAIGYEEDRENTIIEGLGGDK
tara:strand:+ start:109 stop:351 length:243 start_codon:yes stop_codon:yes gene_type:complete